MLTDLQLKILKYISKRKTPATAREIQLQVLSNLDAVSRALKTLTNKGCINSKPVIIGFVKDRHYEFVTMTPEPKSAKRSFKKFAKINITLENKYYNDPFGMTR